MRLLVMSDVHVEFHRDGGGSLLDSLPQADTLVLAGDIGVGHPSQAGTASFLAKVVAKYPHVVFVLGNHDYYGSSPDQVHEVMLQTCLKHRNLHWLGNGSVEIDGVRFLGTTLWFPETPHGPRLSHLMSDFSTIRGFVPWVYRQNEASQNFLNRAVQEGDIVVTHHLPSPQSIAPQYANHPLNQFFLCNMEKLIQQAKPSLWIHGHTHESMDYQIGSTRILCNPFGYARHEENKRFNDHLIVEVPHACGGALP